MQLNLIEENEVSRSGVLDDRGTNLSGPQPSVRRPIPFDAVLPAGLLYDGLVFGVKKVLPAHIKSRSEIPHVHQCSFCKFLAELWLQTFAHFPAVHDRCFSTLLCCLHAEKGLFQWPAMQMGAFIVKENGLIRRIGCRSIEVA